MKFRSAIRSIGLTLLAASCFPFPRVTGDREFAQTYHLKPDGTLELNNINGTVRIEGWDKDEVEVRAVKNHHDKESKLDLVSIDVNSSPTAFPFPHGILGRRRGSRRRIHRACATSHPPEAHQHGERNIAGEGS